jgi:hypothetical protein
LDPEIHERIFEKRLIARDQDPLIIVIPFLQITQVPDPQSMLGYLPGQGPDHRTKVKVTVADMDGENSVGFQVFPVERKRLPGQEVHRNAIATEGVYR